MSNGVNSQNNTLKVLNFGLEKLELLHNACTVVQITLVSLYDY